MDLKKEKPDDKSDQSTSKTGENPDTLQVESITTDSSIKASTTKQVVAQVGLKKESKSKKSKKSKMKAVKNTKLLSFDE